LAMADVGRPTEYKATIIEIKEKLAELISG
jgi:hypothetical protein